MDVLFTLNWSSPSSPCGHIVFEMLVSSSPPKTHPIAGLSFHALLLKAVSLFCLLPFWDGCSGTFGKFFIVPLGSPLSWYPWDSKFYHNTVKRTVFIFKLLPAKVDLLHPAGEGICCPEMLLKSIFQFLLKAFFMCIPPQSTLTEITFCFRVLYTDQRLSLPVYQ